MDSKKPEETSVETAPVYEVLSRVESRVPECAGLETMTSHAHEESGEPLGLSGIAVH